MLLCHLDSNPYQTRATATLLSACQSRVQCVSCLSSARGICAHSKPHALVLCVNFHFHFHLIQQGKRSVCSRQIKVCERKNVTVKFSARRTYKVSLDSKSIPNEMLQLSHGKMQLKHIVLHHLESNHNRAACCLRGCTFQPTLAVLFFVFFCFFQYRL